MKQFISNFMTRSVTGIIGLFLLGLIFFKFDPIFFSAVIICVNFWAGCIELPNLVKPNRLFYWILLLFYCALPTWCALQLNQSAQFRPLLLWLFLLICFHDFCAYLVGNVTGYHKLAPTISPGKTWEGLIGGFIGMTSLIFLFCPCPIAPLKLVLISFVLSALAVSGDLFESYLKRSAGVKDSGTLLPGHGGILDRIDALLFVIPFVYFFRSTLLLFVPINL
jgi:phosphatidate cytidylyltransferase